MTLQDRFRPRDRILQVFVDQKGRIQSLSPQLLVQCSVVIIGMSTQVKITNILSMDNHGLIAYSMAIAANGAIFVARV